MTSLQQARQNYFATFTSREVRIQELINTESMVDWCKSKETDNVIPPQTIVKKKFRVNLLSALKAFKP